jgi:hypothetical protein
MPAVRATHAASLRAVVRRALGQFASFGIGTPSGHAEAAFATACRIVAADRSVQQGSAAHKR